MAFLSRSIPFGFFWPVQVDFLPHFYPFLHNFVSDRLSLVDVGLTEELHGVATLTRLSLIRGRLPPMIGVQPPSSHRLVVNLELVYVVGVVGRVDDR